MANTSLDATIEKLSTTRVRGHRNSNEIVRDGLFVLEQKNGLKKLGDEVWDFLEQLAVAAIDIGQLELADDCILRIDEHFPGSPRVECLQGLRLEARDLNLASKFYDDILERDESNIPIWKRQISVLRQQNKIEEAIGELCIFLDTVYTDLEGWLELADLYASINQYTRSLQALSHALLLAPQNPFHLLHFAETAYTANDVPLAIRYFLLVVDMITAEDKGVARRAWFGIKLCVRTLLQNSSSPSESNTAPPTAKNIELLDELATERLSAAYSTVGKSSSSIPGRSVVLKWLNRST